MRPSPGAAGDLGVIIVAAGSGVRFADADKVFCTLAGRPLLTWSLDLFTAAPDVHSIVLVLGEHTLERGRALVETLGLPGVRLCLGGAARVDSVCAGLAALEPAARLVAVHDAARPLAGPDLVARVVAAAREHGAAVPVVPVSDTIHALDERGRVASTLERAWLRAAQTPQVARRDWLEQALAAGGALTDEAGLLRAAGFPVVAVEGERRNLKITWPGDLIVAEALAACEGA